MRFEVPLLLLAAPGIAGLVAALAFWAQRRRLRLAASWSASLAPVAGRGRRVSVPLLALAALGAALGAAGPRGGRLEQIAESRGLNVLLAVDISRSMLAEDAEPNRLRRASREGRRLLQDIPRDRVGVLAFAGQSYVLAPLTLDHAAVDMYLEALDPDLASTGGTALGSVLRQARQLLNASLEGGDRAIVLFSDGEAHDSPADALAEARSLARDGIRLILVAEGGVRPVRIPLRDATGAVTDYKRDNEGSVVLTHRRDAVLESLAAAADGVVIGAEVPDQAGAVREVLRSLARRPLRERRLADLQPLAWIAGLVAALVLLVHTATRRTLALAALTGLVVVPALRAQQGDRAQRVAQAAAGREAARRGEGGDTAWFNAGTAALAAGSLEAARDALGRAARALDPDLRFKALYNLGLANLLAARAEARTREARAAEAVASLKQALLLRPGSLSAKWNLELALQPEAPPSGGTRQQQGRSRDERQPQPAEGLSPTEAQALLASVEGSELMTRFNAIRRQRLPTPPVARDW
jgi:Ca-activated chloride channel family protein